MTEFWYGVACCFYKSEAGGPTAVFFGEMTPERGVRMSSSSNDPVAPPRFCKNIPYESSRRKVLSRIRIMAAVAPQM